MIVIVIDGFWLCVMICYVMLCDVMLDFLVNCGRVLWLLCGVGVG